MKQEDNLMICFDKLERWLWLITESLDKELDKNVIDFIHNDYLDLLKLTRKKWLENYQKPLEKKNYSK